MVHVNDAQENVEEPIAISGNGEAVVTSWDMWVNLCKNESLKKKVETLRLRVSDEKKDEPLEIKGFEKMKELVIEDGSFGKTRSVTIKNDKLLDSVRIGNNCFNKSIRSSKRSIVSVKNCRYLTSFSVEKESFKHLLKCEFVMTDGLQTISWGSGSFDKCKSFYPKDVNPTDDSPKNNDIMIGSVRICQINEGIEITRSGIGAIRYL